MCQTKTVLVHFIFRTNVKSKGEFSILNMYLYIFSILAFCIKQENNKMFTYFSFAFLWYFELVFQNTLCLLSKNQ